MLTTNDVAAAMYNARFIEDYEISEEGAFCHINEYTSMEMLLDTEGVITYTVNVDNQAANTGGFHVDEFLENTDDIAKALRDEITEATKR